MRPGAFLFTAALLGIFVLWAGCYGVCYCAAQLSGKRRFLVASLVTYGLQCITALAVILLTPLATQWKVLIVASAVAYLWIPPVVWRYLVALHQPGEEP